MWEARLNRFAQYRVPIEGLHLHVIMERGSGSAPRPLVLLNGWPSSIAEFLDVIEPLAHPERFGGDIADAFTVIVPSYPGFGFSDPPSAPISARAVARMVRALVEEIVPEERYFIHGGDWGATIASWIAFDAPDKVIGLHLNSAVLRPPLAGLDLAAEEEVYLEERTRRLMGEGGYQAIQGTKPQTLSYGLTDSPVGMSAWILEKFKGWVVPGTNEEPPFDLDLLLTNVMIYWLNGINAANWMYCDLADGAAVTLPDGGRVGVPTALFLGERDLPPVPPDQWVLRSYDLIERRIMPGMGHFPWMEPVAEAQIEHLRAFFRRYRAK
jgi:pimeloyl-ACP methyl ester carboxylesterase